MIRLLLLTMLCALAVTGQDAGAQLILTPAGLLQSAEELQSTVGGESDAAGIISYSISEFLRQSTPPRTVTLVASQIPEPWLPAISGVQFTRLDDEAAQAHLNRCGTFLWVRIEPQGNQMVVTIGEGNKCRSAGRLIRFSRASTAWQPDSGIGGGFGSGIDHCECS